MLRVFPVRFPFRFCRRASRGVALASASVFLFAHPSVFFVDGNASFLILRELFRIGDGFRLRIEQLDRLFPACEFDLPFAVRARGNVIIARFLIARSRALLRFCLFFCHDDTSFFRIVTHYNIKSLFSQDIRANPRASLLFCRVGMKKGDAREFRASAGSALLHSSRFFPRFGAAFAAEEAETVDKSKSL